jgi:GNAT superfamily N-acetyltransferase
VAWRERVDAWWAGVLRLPVHAVVRGGRFTLDHVDHVGVLEVPGRPPLFYGPSAVIAALDGGPLSDGRGTVEALGRRVHRVLGPTCYGYVTADGVPAAGGQVRALGVDDLDALDVLHGRTAADQVDESGTDGLPAFGVFDGDQLLAVACLKSWHAMPTIGVLTDPAHRGRGMARQVVAAAARAGLARREEVQYRAFHDNRASVAVGRASGFVHYADHWVIELVPLAPRSTTAAQPLPT